MSIAQVMREEKVHRENVYYVLPSRNYYRNRLSFPFDDRSKIEAVIPFEIRDYLPDPDMDCVTDFAQWGSSVLAFSATRGVIRELLEDMEEFRGNLRAVIPYDYAVFRAVRVLAGEPSYLLVGMEPEGVYLQQVLGDQLLSGLFTENYASNGHGGEQEEPSRAETENQLSAHQLSESLFTELRMLTRRSGNTPVFLAAGSQNGDQNGLLEKVEAVLAESTSGEGVRVRQLAAAGGIRASEEPLLSSLKPAPHSLALLGAVFWSRGSRSMVTGRTGLRPAAAGAQAAMSADRVNLLKYEFKPRPRGYLSLKDFSIAGILLLALLFMSTVGLVMDNRLHRNQVRTLEQATRQVTQSAFGEPTLEVARVRQMVQELRGRINLVERNTDPGNSSLLLLRELALYFPGDVAVEYTDIIIQPGNIRLEGKARAFSDIDKIERELLLSDRFGEVTVVNTGSSGSTQGFTVNFTLDIKIVDEAAE
jgi:hypothetical protein